MIYPGVGRFIWWLYHDQNAAATLTQAVSAAVTAIVTAILCRISYRYMVLTRQLSDTAVNQLRASVRPLIKVTLDFGGARDSYGVPVFKDKVTITIRNVGMSSIVIKKVVLEWEVSEDNEPLEVVTATGEAVGLRNVVLTPTDSHADTLRINAKVNHFGIWSDWVSATTLCEDIGGLAPVEYFYRQVDGLKIVSI
jgi:hypothetical protein